MPRFLNISATYIRELIRAGKSIKYLVLLSVEEEITNYGILKKFRRNNPELDNLQQSTARESSCIAAIEK